jgi:P2 family phage contractile tail tube protein
MELPAGLDKMEARIKFNSIYADFIALASNPFVLRTIIVRASKQDWDQRGVAREVPVKAELRGFFKEFDTGKVKARDAAEAEATISVVYYRLEVDGREVVEVDVMNNIYKVEGRDILQNYRANLGG